MRDKLTINEQETFMKKRILFVDDEPSILEMLRHMLRNMLPEWEMAFAKSGQEALALMAHEPFDVIVSDVRMPGMDGSELLNKVKLDYPKTARFVFSSESDREVVYRLIGSTHQFLLKPNDLSIIKDTIARAFSLKEVLTKDSLENVVSQIKTLPSIPELYYEVVRELQTPYPSIERVGNLISQDIAMSAKLLQMVNSAFFGLRQRISNPTQAAALLGLDVLKSLVLVVHIFTEQDGLSVEGFSLKTLWTHSLSVGILSQDIALQQNIEKSATEDAFIAGLFHDVGKLILMVNLAQPYSRALSVAREKRLPLTEVEKEILGASHAEVGAYLLGLWGFAEPIIQAIAFHHQPTRCKDSSFGPLTTVHVANVFDHESHPHETREAPITLDMTYLNKMRLADRIPAWKAAVENPPAPAKDTSNGR
jgi:HD-like signal output (HDOD) protein